jgi:hypothetical protein
MTDLLTKALAAHGGLDHWRRLGSVSADLSLGGATWDLKRQTGLFAACTYDADLRQQRAVFGNFGAADRRASWTPDRVELRDGQGAVLEARDHPRDGFKGHVMDTPWDKLQAAYFCAYALWTYVTLPFLYTFPGFETEEIEPWTENGETWRRLKATFPQNIASHTRQQTSYFGPDGRLRRHDYGVDVMGGTMGAHYVGDYHDCEGIQVPFWRRIYPLGPDNQRVPEPVLISIDVKRLEYAQAV